MVVLLLVLVSSFCRRGAVPFAQGLLQLCLLNLAPFAFTAATLVRDYAFVMTHDAATAYLQDSASIPEAHLITNWARTQNATFTEQLSCGARAFDLRPKCKQVVTRTAASGAGGTTKTSEPFFHHGPIGIPLTVREGVREIRDATIVPDVEQQVQGSPEASEDSLRILYISHVVDGEQLAEEDATAVGPFGSATAGGPIAIDGGGGSRPSPCLEKTLDVLREEGIPVFGFEQEEQAENVGGSQAKKSCAALLNMEMSEVITRYGSVVAVGAACVDENYDPAVHCEDWQIVDTTGTTEAEVATATSHSGSSSSVAGMFEGVARRVARFLNTNFGGASGGEVVGEKNAAAPPPPPGGYDCYDFSPPPAQRSWIHQGKNLDEASPAVAALEHPLEFKENEAWGRFWRYFFSTSATTPSSIKQQGGKKETEGRFSDSPGNIRFRMLQAHWQYNAGAISYGTIVLDSSILKDQECSEMNRHVAEVIAGWNRSKMYSEGASKMLMEGPSSALRNQGPVVVFAGFVELDHVCFGGREVYRALRGRRIRKDQEQVALATRSHHIENETEDGSASVSIYS